MPDEYDLYLRKSVGRAGVSRQRTITTAHVEKLGGRITRELTDTDSTAYARPGEPPPPRKDFRRLLASLRPGVGIAAWHADRLLRDGEDTATFTRACINAGVTIIETARGGTYDLSTATGRKRLRDDASDAAYEVDHARERILAQQAEMRGEGRWTGGRRPFGWDVDSDAPGGLVLREAEAELIRDGTAALLAGASLMSIARAWDAAGTDREWTRVLVRQVLTRPLNAALMSLRGEVTGEGAWPAIVSEPQWRAVRALVADPARRTTPGPERRYLLSGVALCSACGTPLGTSANGRPQYRCRRSLERQSAAGGPHATRAVAALDAYVTVLALGRLKRDDAHLLLRPDHSGDRAALLAAEAGQRAEHDGLWQLFRAKTISARELAEGRAETDAELERIRGQLAALDAADVLAPMIADPDGAWERAGVDVRRAAVSRLMMITLFPARLGRPPGTRRGDGWFDAGSVDVRWVRRLPSDG